ncbi:MAG: RNA methyltransferase [Sediminibacterium sp.]
MLSKNEVKYIQSLCHKKHRQEEALFIAEGPKLVGEILQSNYQIRKLYATADWIGQHTPVADTATITPEELIRISALQTPHQVLAVVEQKLPTTEPLSGKGLSLVLDGIQDPGNLGTIIRIADWFGIGQIIASEDTVELYNPKVIQSTMGSFLRVTVWYKPLHPFLEAATMPVYGALMQGRSLFEMKGVKEGLLVIGNESKGISKALLPLVTDPVTIPRMGEAESLNAGVAAGVLVSWMVGRGGC